MSLAFSSKKPRARKIEANRYDAAEQMLAKRDLKGIELFGFTQGQFSLMELVQAVLARTGPADVAISTWTAAVADLRDAYNLLECGKIRAFRLLIDRSFETRQPQYCDSVRDLFGDDSVRATRIHAKFALIRNEQYDLSIRTSMNLNTNRRFEQFELSDDPALADFLDGVLASVWGAGGGGFSPDPGQVEAALDAPFE